MEVTLTLLRHYAQYINNPLNIIYGGATGHLNYFYRAITAYNLIESGKYPIDDPNLSGKLLTDSVSIEDKYVEELISIVSDIEIINLILAGKFPKYMLCIQFVESYYPGFRYDIKRFHKDERLISSIKSVVKNEVFFFESGNKKSFSLRGTVVNLSTQPVKTIAGDLLLISTSISMRYKEDLQAISKKISEYLKEEKEKNGTTFIFSDSSGVRTFSGLNIEFVDLGVRAAKNPRTGNTINVKFI